MTPMFAGGSMLLWMLLGLVVFTFLMQRPLKKQAEAQRQVRESITEDTRVLLTSQIFGTVTHVGDEQLIVEIAPGVEITVMKQAVTRVVTPEEEEFVFADETSSAGSGDVMDDTVEPTPAPVDPAPAEPVEDPKTDPNTRQI